MATMRAMKSLPIGSACLGLLSIPRSGFADEPPVGSALVVVRLRDALVRLGLARSDSAPSHGPLTLFDLKTYTSQTIPVKEIDRVETQFPAKFASDRLGFAKYSAWRIRQALGIRSSTGKVAKVGPDFIHVALGAKSGIERDQIWTVFRDQGAIGGPDSNAELGATRAKMAELRVLEVADRYCTTKRSDALEAPLKVGDIVAP